MTPQSVIDFARGVINDAESATYRNSSATLLIYVNAGMKEVSSLRPDLFRAIGDVTCTPGAVEHLLTFPAAQNLVSVLSIHGGAALTEFDMSAMDRFNPGWRTDTAGDVEQWARLPSDPLRFFIYPKAPATPQTVDVVYTAVPLDLTLTDSITEIPVSYEPALADYVIYRAESKDDEHSNTARATSHYQAFVAKIKGM